MDYFNQQFPTIIQIVLAVVLGSIVGLEREYRKKEAGLRTYSLVCLGSALFTIIGFELAERFNGSSIISIDPTRVIQAVAVGIGFIGGGLIIYRQFHVEGLTTAAGLWVVSAIGIAVGAELYSAAIFVTILSVIILLYLKVIEEKFFGKK